MQENLVNYLSGSLRSRVYCLCFAETAFNKTNYLSNIKNKKEHSSHFMHAFENKSQYHCTHIHTHLMESMYTIFSGFDDFHETAYKILITM